MGLDGAVGREVSSRKLRPMTEAASSVATAAARSARSRVRSLCFFARRMKT